MIFSQFSMVNLLSHRRRKAGILPSLEDLLFYTIAEGQEKIPAHKFTTVSPSATAEVSHWLIKIYKNVKNAPAIEFIIRLAVRR